MRILCLGGGGRICRESILDLVEFSDFQQITVADVCPDAAQEVSAWLGDPRVDAVTIDAHDQAATVKLMQRYDIVMDGTPISRSLARKRASRFSTC